MTTPARRYLLEKHHAELSDWEASEDAGPSDRLSIEIEERRSYVDALRDFDPGISFVEQLAVRLTGDAARRGLLDLQLAPILDGISRIFREVHSVNLGLADIGSGSTILYLRPVPLLADDGEVEQEEAILADPSLPVNATPADNIGRTLVKVVETTEGTGDLRAYQTYVRGLEVVSKTLDEHDLEVEFSWSSKSGSQSAARLTSAGRRYLRRLKETSPATDEHPVSGRVTELRESGLVKVKTGISRTSTSYEVHVESEILLELRLSLGDSVHMVVEEKLERDRLGRESKRRYDFVRLLPRPEQLELNLRAEDEE